MILWSLLLDAVRAALFGLSHVFGGSLGFGIISLSLLVRLALLPWSLRAAQRGIALRAALQELQPRLRRIRSRYAGDPARLREATLREYSDAGVNPLRDAGLGVTAIQLPLGLAIYHVVREAVTASPFLWISNLARPDFAMSAVVGGLTLLLGLSAPAVASPVPPIAMAVLMSATSFLIVFHFSSGLALYWASTTGVSVFQNVLVKRSCAAH